MYMPFDNIHVRGYIKTTILKKGLWNTSFKFFLCVGIQFIMYEMKEDIHKATENIGVTHQCAGERK